MVNPLGKKNIGLHLILCFFFSFQNLKLHIGSFFLTFIYQAIPALLSEMGAKGLFFLFFFLMCFVQLRQAKILRALWLV